MRINEYFTEEEFTCKCGCGQTIINNELVEVLTDIREYYNVPVMLTNANRCIIHNKEVGGVDKSKHLTGEAADIVVQGIDPLEVYIYFDNTYPVSKGVGKYNTFTHIDVRKDKARWGE